MSDDELHDVFGSDAELSEEEEEISASMVRQKRKQLRKDVYKLSKKKKIKGSSRAEDEDKDVFDEGEGPRKKKRKHDIDDDGQEGDEKDSGGAKVNDDGDDDDSILGSALKNGASDNDSFIENDRQNEDYDSDDVIKTKGGWTNDNDIEDIDNSGDMKPKSYFDQQLEIHKALKRRKRTESKNMENEVVAFVLEMMKARDNDVRAFNAQKPATNKLKMLPRVEYMLRRSDYRECLLNNRLLSVLKTWLDPMPDGTLPNLTIRSRILELLLDFPVNEEWTDRLRQSKGLGKVINFLSKKDPHEPNTRIAKKLIDNWSRPIFEVTTDFRSLNDEYERVEVDNQHKKKRLSSGAGGSTGVNDKATEELRRKRNELTAGILKNRAGVPDKIIFNFKKMPASALEVDDKDLRRGFTGKSQNLERVVKSMRSSFKKSERAVNVSIEGREI